MTKFKVRNQFLPIDKLKIVTRQLKNGWLMVWTYHVDRPNEKIHVSSYRGNCRVHFSPGFKFIDNSYTAYKVNPFREVGIFTTANEAMAEAQKPWRE